MSQQTEPAVAEQAYSSAPMQLDDLIEAITRGVTRALAEQEDVSGHVIREAGGPRPRPLPVVIAGFFNPYPWPFPTSGGGSPFPGNGTPVQVRR